MTDAPTLRQPLPVAAFAAATLTPLGLFALGLTLEGAWLWSGFLYMFALSAILDRLIPHTAGVAIDGQEFPGSDALLVIIALSGLVMLPVASWAIAGSSALSDSEARLLFLGCSLWLGQVGHPAAHELIHRGNRWLFRLGIGVYAAILFGQHASAHRLVHHHNVATDRDPNSARKGESFYRFALRAWIGSFRAGRAAETALRRRKGAGGGLHPYLWHLAGSAAALGLAYVLAGGGGVLAWWGMAALAQLQILVSDYVQHYGLRRATLPDGRTEPVGPAHSWNSGPWFSSALMLNAPRHSDHHSHPSRPYPALRLGAEDEAPRLPWPLPVACTIALIPPLWKRAIGPALRHWQPKRPAPQKVTQG
jgi:alkane 1-monooxygenase